MPRFPTPMVDVVQLVEHQVVILAVAGSSPVIHPDETPPASRRRGFSRLGTFFVLLSIPVIAVRHHGVGPIRFGTEATSAEKCGRELEER